MAALVRENQWRHRKWTHTPHCPMENHPVEKIYIYNNILHSMYLLNYLWSMTTHPFTSVVRDQMTLLHHMHTVDKMMTSAHGWTRPDTSVHLGGPATNEAYTLMTWGWRHHFGDCTTHVGDCAITHVDDAILSDDVRRFCLTMLRHVS